MCDHDAPVEPEELNAVLVASGVGVGAPGDVSAAVTLAVRVNVPESATVAVAVRVGGPDNATVTGVAVRVFVVLPLAYSSQPTSQAERV